MRRIFILPRYFIDMDTIDVDVPTRLEAVNEVLSGIFKDGVSVTNGESY